MLLPDEINVRLYWYSENKDKGTGNLVSVWKKLKSLVHDLGKCHHVLHIVSELNMQTGVFLYDFSIAIFTSFYAQRYRVIRFSMHF